MPIAAMAENKPSNENIFDAQASTFRTPIPLFLFH